MNLNDEKDKLITLLEKYVNCEIDLKTLNDYAWVIIDYFSDESRSQNIPAESFENEFWYTIWQLQHKADEEPEHDRILQKEIRDSLQYLKNNLKMPASCIGRRP